MSILNKLAKPEVYGICADNPTTLSYAMHTAGFKSLGLNCTYSCFDTKDTKSALEAMRVLGISGFSLTIPHKESAMQFVDELSEAATKVGAINTVKNSGNKLIGDNTDVDGIVNALLEAEVSPAGRKVIIVGAGGASRAAVYALATMGATNITVANRSKEKLSQITKDFGVNAISLEELKKLDQLDILINASPLGSKALKLENEQPPISEEAVTDKTVVFDMVTHETLLTKLAKKNRAKVVPGIRMLIFQAQKQFQIFTGKSVELSILEKALKVEAI